MTQTVEKIVLDVPVHHSTQVLVIGGGPAGFATAVTAARKGAQVTVVERGGYLGGMWTLGIVSPFFANKNKPGLNKELREALQTENSWGGLWNIAFDHNQMIMTLDDIALQAGVKMMLYSTAQKAIIKDNKIKGVIVATKSGLVSVSADLVIDCSGDGDIAADAGAEFKFGREEDGLTQPMTMMFKVGGVNPNYPADDIIGWYKELRNRIGEKQLLEKIPYDYPAIIKLPREGEALFQWTHMKKYNGSDADDLTEATLEGRRQVKDALEFLKEIKDVIGDVYLLELPATIGVRDTRRIACDYYISEEDVFSGQKFSDSVSKVTFGIDIHEPAKKAQTVVKHSGFYIPLRSLMVKGISNLMVAGRCISGSWKAHAAYRVTGNCIDMGEAAGSVAVLAASKNKNIRKIDFADLNISIP